MWWLPNFFHMLGGRPIAELNVLVTSAENVMHCYDFNRYLYKKHGIHHQQYKQQDG